MTFKKNKLRHQILEILTTNANPSVYTTRDVLDYCVTTEEIQKQSGLSHDRTISLTSIMIDRNEIKRLLGRDKKEAMYILDNGITAYAERNYLKEPWNKLNESIYNKSKWLVPILSLLIAGFSLSYQARKSEKNNSLQMNKMKQQLDSLLKSKR